jgi:hypothetical protein
MAFASLDSIIASLGAGKGENSIFSKASITTTLGRWYSHWKSAGVPAAGATPATGAGAAPTAATTGAIKFTNPSGSDKKHLLRLLAGGPTSGILMLVDRLVHTSGLSGTNVGAQTINSTALTRRTDAVGVMLALEVYTQIGATPQTATISYTNQNGTAGRSGTVAIPANALAGEFIGPMTLQAGDTGVKSVQTLTLGGSTGTAGDFGITLYYILASIPYSANTIEERDQVLQLQNLPELKTDGCLALLTYATTTATGLQSGEVGMAAG